MNAAPAHDDHARTSLPMLALAAIPGLITLWLMGHAPSVAGGDPVIWTFPWIPSLGIDLAFRLDGLAFLFASLIAGIGTLVFLYAPAYLAGHRHLGRLMIYLTGFMAAMLGLVLADDLITMFVFWELTTITSYLLIGFDHEDRWARNCAQQSLLVTGAGGLALLAGLILMAVAGGTYRISELLAAGSLADHALYPGILVLVLLGCFTKSAQVPFHFWLPNAMAAPTPISAYLHSATMVKAGVYLLARFNPLLGDDPAWVVTLTAFGAVTAVTASIWALRQTDLKLMLAYTTVMALGTLVMLIGIGNEEAILAAAVFLAVHAFYKAGLFLVVGNVDHGAGSRDRRKVGGLWVAMPVTAVATLLAGLSMAGLPPFIGFVGKELIYGGALGATTSPVLILIASIAANALMVAVALILLLDVFTGAERAPNAAPHEAGWPMLAGPVTLSGLGLLFGVLVDVFGELFALQAAQSITDGAVAGDNPYAHAAGHGSTGGHGHDDHAGGNHGGGHHGLALFHGFNLPLLLSVITLAAGYGLFRLRLPLLFALKRMEADLPAPEATYDGLMGAVVLLARALTPRLQHGLLRGYLAALFATLAAVIGGTAFLTGTAVPPVGTLAAPGVVDIALGLLVIAGSAIAVQTESRLTALCGLGVSGAGISLIFLLYGAIDVGITQLMVETLALIFVAIAFLRLPRFRGDAWNTPDWRLASAVIAAASGIAMAFISLAVFAVPVDRRLTDFFEAESFVTAHGRNVVNVILVDFRALDTFGEISVVAMAGIAAVALIMGAGRTRSSSEAVEAGLADNEGSGR